MLPEIEIYTSPTCQPCKMLKKMLDDAKINYTLYDISTDDKARETLIEFGFRSVPVVMVGGWNHVIEGFNPTKIQELIDQRK